MVAVISIYGVLNLKVMVAVISIYGAGQHS